MPFLQFRELQAGEFFIVFADPAGDGADNCAVQFMSHKWLDIPLVYHAHITASFMTPLIHQKLIEVHKLTGIPPTVAYEINNGGNFELDRLNRLNRYGDYNIYTQKTTDPTGHVIDTGKLGWSTNGATRPKMLQELKDAVESDLIHLYHRQTVNELFSFIVNDTGRAEAEKKAHDDLVMALAGVWQLYQSEAPPDINGSGVVETESASNIGKQAGILVAHDYE